MDWDERMYTPFRHRIVLQNVKMALHSALGGLSGEQTLKLWMGFEYVYTSRYHSLSGCLGFATRLESRLCC